MKTSALLKRFVANLIASHIKSSMAASFGLGVFVQMGITRLFG